MNKNEILKETKNLKTPQDKKVSLSDWLELIRLNLCSLPTTLDVDLLQWV